MGGRNLHAVRETEFAFSGSSYVISNIHSPIVSVGKGKILKFDDKFENAQADGLTYVLYDNVWGTNFPLWYEENAMFSFEIKSNRE